MRIYKIILQTVRPPARNRGARRNLSADTAGSIISPAKSPQLTHSKFQPVRRNHLLLTEVRSKLSPYIRTQEERTRTPQCTGIVAVPVFSWLVSYFSLKVQLIRTAATTYMLCCILYQDYCASKAKEISKICSYHY